MKRYLSRRQWMVMVLMTFSLAALLMLPALSSSAPAVMQAAKARGLVVFDVDEEIAPPQPEFTGVIAKARGLVVFDVDSPKA